MNLKTTGIFLLFTLLFQSCSGQVKENESPMVYRPEISVVHQDSISLRAETLPEYKVDLYDPRYQGNQISGVVRTVFQDSKGDLWFGTQNGLCRHDGSGLVYFVLRSWDGQEVTVHKILEDKAGNIWIGFGGGIAKYDGKYFTTYHQKDILVKNGVWSMAMDSKGILWIGTTLGVFTFDGEVLTSFEIPEGKIDSTKGVSTSKMIHCIIEDSKGMMWFGSNGGVYIYDGVSLSRLSEKDGLLSDFAHQILEDAQGNFWISTSKGLFRYDGNDLVNMTESLYETDEGIGCLMEDRNGTIWFTANKRDIYHYANGTITKIQIEESGNIPLPFQIYQDREERLWFVGFKGAFRLENNAFVNVTRDGPW